MIEIKFLGGAGEVGRSCFLVDTGVEKFLLDYGLNVQQFEKPIQPPINLDGVFLSHAHLDHSGLLPELYKRGYQKSVYLTRTSFGLAGLLLRDAVKVQKRNGLEPFFLSHDIDAFEKKVKVMDYGASVEFSKSTVELRDAGHIPGSSCILLDTGKQRLLYTGDFNSIETTLMKGGDTQYKDIDALLCESTYSYKNHPPRKEMAKKLAEHIKGYLENNGTVLLPCFSVGRTQEILLILAELGYPIYMDGMGIEATKIILHEKGPVFDHEKLRKAFGRAHKIQSVHERAKVLEKPAIIITSGGMLQGGPIHYYLKKLHNREDCSIVLTGYQADGTPGKQLLETHKFFEGADMDVKMDIQFLDFSAHIGKDNLFKLIEKINPKKVVPVHGGFIPEFVAELKEKGFDAVEAKNGDVVQI